MTDHGAPPYLVVFCDRAVIKTVQATIGVLGLASRVEVRAWATPCREVSVVDRRVLMQAVKD